MVIGQESVGAAKNISGEHRNETEMMNDFAI
jgi:hypothetical protein